MPWKIRREEPEQIKKEILAQGVRCAVMELDLTQKGSILTLLDAVKQELGIPSILINNATHSKRTSIDDFDVNELDKHYELNIRATTELIIEFIRIFKNKNGGRIVNLTSGQSLGEMPEEIAYAMTKGAIETLTQTISQQIAARGITINAVNPGPTDTGWMTKVLEKELLERFPMKRIGQPKDCAQLIGFLCSPDAAWVTGQIIHSEGGFIRS